MHVDMPSIILDILNVLDSVTSLPDEDTKDRFNFCAIVKECEKVGNIISGSDFVCICFMQTRFIHSQFI